jgi:hypothetical protein
MIFLAVREDSDHSGGRGEKVIRVNHLVKRSPK